MRLDTQFPTVNHRIYCHKFLMLSNQMKRYICKFIMLSIFSHSFAFQIFIDWKSFFYFRGVLEILTSISLTLWCDSETQSHRTGRRWDAPSAAPILQEWASLTPTISGGFYDSSAWIWRKMSSFICCHITIKIWMDRLCTMISSELICIIHECDIKCISHS